MSSNRRRLAPRPETAARREEILKASLEIFGSKGFNKGPLAEIAEQVGMTHAGVLHHFGSKDKLLVEVLRYRDSADLQDLEGQHIPDGADLFRHLVRTAFDNEQRPGIVQAYAVLSAESVTDKHPGHEYFVERYATLRVQLADAFHIMCEEHGVTDQTTVDHAAASILAVMDGLQVQWLLQPDSIELAETSAFAIETLVTAVLDPRPSALAIHDVTEQS
ncbi:TetR/AcrR family transcriptional regulator [Demequina flava]|uniref:TetR/AcrR family transcriptional regulator n=1 Tax=Demequina flava TaxID=1095025 RepID=UPI0007867019|nr:TetR/AcrR family transcriptional regulator [Demequina flava]